MCNIEDFKKDEYRNEYYVSKDMKGIWLSEISILEEIKRICAKYNIKYFAICGTLIGAVRENGFIPWDDDIDLGMTRENAEKFVECAKKELPSNLVLVGNQITKNFFKPHLQVRDANTTCISKADFGLNYCKGCWVDIFIFDKFPANHSLNSKFRRKLTARNRMLNMYTFYRNSDSLVKKYIKYIISRIYVLCNGGIKAAVKKYDKFSGKYNYLTSDYFYDYLAFKPWRVLKTKPEVFDDLVDHVFEFTSIKIPKNYFDALEPEYGPDFMVRKKAPNGHGNLFIDPSKSYVFYDKLNKKEFKKLFEKKD